MDECVKSLLKKAIGRHGVVEMVDHAAERTTRMNHVVLLFLFRY